MVAIISPTVPLDCTLELTALSGMLKFSLMGMTLRATVSASYIKLELLVCKQVLHIQLAKAVAG